MNRQRPAPVLTDASTGSQIDATFGAKEPIPSVPIAGRKSPLALASRGRMDEAGVLDSPLELVRDLHARINNMAIQDPATPYEPEPVPQQQQQQRPQQQQQFGESAGRAGPVPVPAPRSNAYYGMRPGPEPAFYGGSMGGLGQYQQQQQQQQPLDLDYNNGGNGGGYGATGGHASWPGQARPSVPVRPDPSAGGGYLPPHAAALLNMNLFNGSPQGAAMAALFASQYGGAGSPAANAAAAAAVAAAAAAAAAASSSPSMSSPSSTSSSSHHLLQQQQLHLQHLQQQHMQQQHLQHQHLQQLQHMQLQQQQQQQQQQQMQQHQLQQHQHHQRDGSGGSGGSGVGGQALNQFDMATLDAFTTASAITAADIYFGHSATGSMLSTAFIGTNDDSDEPAPRPDLLGGHIEFYSVQFKRGRTGVYYVEDPQLMSFQPGHLVIVEADRGRDLGRIVGTVGATGQGKKIRAGGSGYEDQGRRIRAGWIRAGGSGQADQGRVDQGRRIRAGGSGQEDQGRRIRARGSGQELGGALTCLSLVFVARGP